MTESHNAADGGGAPNALPAQSAWPAAAASIVFSIAAFYLFYLYYMEPWEKLASPDSIPDRALHRELVFVAKRLAIYKVFSVFAIVWAVWARRGRGRWPAGVALALALPTLLLWLLG